MKNALNLKVNKKLVMMTIYIFIYILILFFVYIPIKIYITYTILKYDYDKNNGNGIYYLNSYNIYTHNENTEKKQTLFYGIDFYKEGIYHLKKDNYKFYYSNGLICISKNYNDKKWDYKFGNCKNKNLIFNSEKKAQNFIVPKNGKYKIELWGASAGNGYALANYYDKAQNGAYVSGEINLSKNQILYLYVGGKGQDAEIIEDYERMTIFYYPSIGGLGGFNGGGDGASDPQTDAGSGGGGATDIRLIKGKWDDFESLKSRIMVAGGAGGNSRYWKIPNQYNDGIGQGGAGGTTTGINAAKRNDLENPYGLGATQTKGYKFGQGQTGIYCKSSSNGLGGGAGGYFGSYSGQCPEELFSPPTGAGGGSSYVSGCDHCKSITKNSTPTAITFKNKIHYSGLEFLNIIMKSGIEKMPNPYDEKIIGNKGDGVVKITFIN